MVWDVDKTTEFIESVTPLSLYDINSVHVHGGICRNSITM